ncbi:hypothetical protein CJ030_MR2G011739 [Morella rubra]|uniref:Myb/SANT-like domain-containing protein n=1 Tax=Morella rubra TaxID=262757 RepID=A0A6A1WJ05_9ROSI|nr:hypothetical protein CJ030_MR2G011739 [Morella rubra]
MQSQGRAERSRANLGGYSYGTTQAPSSSQATARMSPITSSFKLYDLRSHMLKLVEDRQKCLVVNQKKDIKRNMVRMEEVEDSTLWNATLESLFVELLMEESNAGHIINAKFNIQAQVTVTVALNRSGLIRFHLTTKQVKRNWNRMKRNHSDFAFVLKQIGLGWRPEANTVEGTNKVWANLMRPWVQREERKVGVRDERCMLRHDEFMQFEGGEEVDRLLKDKDLHNVLMAMLVERRMVRLSQLVRAQSVCENGGGRGTSGALSPPNTEDVQKIDVNPPKGTRVFPPEEMRLVIGSFIIFTRFEFIIDKP